MQFTVNQVEYDADEYLGGFAWSNARNEESLRPFRTLLEAQQDAVEWEDGRKERARIDAEAEEDAAEYARNQWQGRNGDVL